MARASTLEGKSGMVGQAGNGCAVGSADEDGGDTEAVVGVTDRAEPDVFRTVVSFL